MLYSFRSRIYRYLITHPNEEDLIFGQFLNLAKEFAEKEGINFSRQRMDIYNVYVLMSNIKEGRAFSI